MREKTRVFIAAPLTSSGTEDGNIRAVIEAADQLSALGFVPFIPHLFFFWNLISPHEREFWLEIDKQWLLACHCLLRIGAAGGGADGEHELADREGKRVYLSVRELSEFETVYRARID